MTDQPAEPVDDIEAICDQPPDPVEVLNESGEEPAGRSTEPPTGDSRSTRKPRDGLIASVVIAAVVVVIDQITKHIAVSQLSDYEPVHVIWTLQWHLTHNSGMAFSRGTGFGPILGALALVVVVILLIGLRRSGSRLGKFAVGLVIGGAVGNIIDRLFRGEGWLRGSVVDFIDLQWWPIFNVADMAISVGGVLLVLGALFESVHAKRALQ